MYNIYIDESCHLEHDGMPVMCIGYMKINTNDYLDLKEKIKTLQLKYKSPTELKWNKVSNSRLQLYKALVDFFFNSDINFRCILIKYKEKLDHKQFNQGDHDNFYYKLIYYLLKSDTNSQDDDYNVYLDIKDTRGKERLTKIEEVLQNSHKGSSPFKKFQHLHSSENLLIQLTDIFIGAVTFKARGLEKNENANKAKIELVNYIEMKSGYSLDEGTEPWEKKFNIFDHQPKKIK